MTDDNTPITRVLDGANDMLTDRRSFMSGAAKLGVGGALLSMTGIGSAAAQDDDTEEVTDIDILNYALTLEHLEAEYYTQALDHFSERDFESFGSPGMMTFDTNLPRYETYQNYEKIRDHEIAHVETLTQVIEDLGGTPVEAAEYDFPYNDIHEFVDLSATIEDVGVSAYAGAAPMIQNSDLLSAALSIHSVEARHASYIRLQRDGGSPPFEGQEGAFDPARTMDEVIAIASQFIVSD
ncbi:ferritin-like domain-containing protein [Halomarina rubra]|uniref:Ferritin-like domain-containing protein n=1 Tax=Halomarina rubra TaxID=2071873 RepID=A0ABD6AZH3_9EURY|nr:ferritin-like domain-containing protein [Halomarina rubra]